LGNGLFKCKSVGTGNCIGAFGVGDVKLIKQYPCEVNTAHVIWEVINWNDSDKTQTLKNQATGACLGSDANHAGIVWLTEPCNSNDLGQHWNIVPVMKRK
jgi:hypothetical protein